MAKKFDLMEHMKKIMPLEEFTAWHKDYLVRQAQAPAERKKYLEHHNAEVRRLEASQFTLGTSAPDGFHKLTGLDGFKIVAPIKGERKSAPEGYASDWVLSEGWTSAKERQKATFVREDPDSGFDEYEFEGGGEPAAELDWPGLRVAFWEKGFHLGRLEPISHPADETIEFHCANLALLPRQARHNTPLGAPRTEPEWAKAFRAGCATERKLWHPSTD